MCGTFFLCKLLFKNKFGAKNICLDIYTTFLFTHTVSVPYQCRTQGGPEGHVPPEEAVSALKKTTKKSCTAERKGGGTDRAVTPARK